MSKIRQETYNKRLITNEKPIYSIVQRNSLHSHNVVNQIAIPNIFIIQQLIIFISHLMPKKPRCSSCSTGWCKNHVLELNPLSNSLYYKRNFKIRLCPRINKKNNYFQKVIPLLNPDKKYYTPSFYLQEEKKYYTDNDQRVLRNHKLKVEQDINSNQTIWVPRHARKRNYCFVCKEDYNDYLDHLNDQTHKKCLRSNTFTSLIMDLQDKFAQQNKPSKQDDKQSILKRQVPTEDSSSISISEQTPRPFEFIRKLVKKNEDLQSGGLHLKIEQN